MESKIPGVIITPLRRIPDERGSICHIFKKTEPEYEQFGEVYLSHAYPGVIKGVAFTYSANTKLCSHKRDD